MLDRARYFAEECDSLQGFQCFVDVDSVCAQRNLRMRMRTASI
jgi:hypothetical protein